MKKSLLFLGLSAFLIGCVCIPDVAYASAMKVDYIIAEKSTVKKNISFSGKIVAENENVQKSENIFVIDEILVKPGDEIEVGDEIISIDVDKTSAAYKSAGETYDGTSKMKSEYAGVVSEIKVENDTSVKTSQELLSVIDISNLSAVIIIPEDNFNQVKKGQNVVITGNGFNGKYTGSIESISAVATTDSSSLTYVSANVKIDKPDKKLKAGFNIKAKMVVKVLKDIIVVNSNCINQDDNGEYVYLLNGDEPVKKYITTDIITKDGTVVLKGIQEGEAIALNAEEIDKSKSFVVGDKK